MRSAIKVLAITACLASTLYMETTQASVINTVGNASVSSNGSIQLTDSTGQAGAAWFTSALSTLVSFDVTFSFSLANPSSSGGLMADGISFALQNKGTNVVGGGGGDIGYTGLEAVGSIIQTYTNNRLGLNTTNGISSTTKAAPFDMGTASLVMGTETITYDVVQHLLSMTGTFNANGQQYSVSDSTTINLFNKFGSTMYAGFTGATGGASANQQITGYSVHVPEPASMALLGLGLAGMGLIRRRQRKI